VPRNIWRSPPSSNTSPAGRCDPDRVCAVLREIGADLIGLQEIASGAGHDARYLHYICPTAMIFIPCKAGISHNEAESIQKEHATAGARVLAEAVLDLTNAE